MREYLTVVEAAERWNVTTRRVQFLCNQNRINGAVKESGVWLIPFTAKKPERLKSGKKTKNVKHVTIIIINLKIK